MAEADTFLGAMGAAVYTTDAHGRITYFNDAAANLWGRKPELGAMWCGSWRIFTNDGALLPHDECPMAITLRTGVEVRGVTAVAERPDGARVPFMPIPSLLRDSSGAITGAINVLIDLTERAPAEQQSALLAAIVSCSDDAIISKTLTGQVTSWNAAAERVFGYTAAEMIGQPIIRLIPPELHYEETDILARLGRGERIEHFETIRLTKDGRRIPVSLTVSPVRDATGRISGASKVARDITESRRAAELQTLLLAELSHRVKNTLATIQGIASQTLRRTPDPALFVESFSGRLQALAAAHAQLTNQSMQRADLGDLIAAQLVSDGDRRITRIGPKVNVSAQAAVNLAMLLHELGANARKYGALSAPAGAVDVSWEVSRTGSDPVLTLRWVERGGPPVTAPTRRGFGTILIESSLRGHGGDAALSFAADGVRCTMVLPLPTDGNEETGLMEDFKAEQGDVRPGLNLAGKRILVVEDEPLIAMSLENCLEDAGCQVVAIAPNIVAALRAVETLTIDAAILDGNLAGKAVDEIAAALSQRGRPFVFVTGYGRDALPAAFRDRPMIEKPFSEAQVTAALERLFAA